MPHPKYACATSSSKKPAKHHCGSRSYNWDPWKRFPIPSHIIMGNVNGIPRLEKPPNYATNETGRGIDVTGFHKQNIIPQKKTNKTKPQAGFFQFQNWRFPKNRSYHLSLGCHPCWWRVFSHTGLWIGQASCQALASAGQLGLQGI